MNELKSLMNKYLNHIDLNTRWINDLVNFYFRIFTKDEATISFLGEGLWGVYPIYFTKNDISTWYDEILQVDDLALREDIRRNFSENPNIEVNWHRANDLVNLTLIYIVHRFLTSKMREKDILTNCTYCLNLLHFKFYSSLQGHKFPYEVDKDIATATYSQLTRKVLVKQLGNWKAVFDFRAACIIDKKGIHYCSLVNLDDDYKVIQIIQEIQNRTRKTANYLTDEFYKVKNEGITIKTTSRIVTDEEEGQRIADDVKSYNNYRNYLQDIIKDRGDLIKLDLVEVIEKQVNRVPKNALEETLKWLSDSSYSKMQKQITQFLDMTLEYSFGIIKKNKFKTNQLGFIIKKLKTMYLSSRTTDKKLLEAKEIGLTLTESSGITKSKSSQVSLRCALMLYVVLRTLSMKFYA